MEPTSIAENPLAAHFRTFLNATPFFAQSMTGFRVAVTGSGHGVGKEMFCVRTIEAIYKYYRILRIGTTSRESLAPVAR